LSLNDVLCWDGGNKKQLSQLKVLLLNNNKISEIPFEMLGEKLTEIQTFDIKDNPLNASTLEFITKFGIGHYADTMNDDK